MKRKQENKNAESAILTKKVKKSEKISKNIESLEKSAKDTEIFLKKGKKSKFEKPTETKKIEKSVKSNYVEKPRKSFGKIERNSEKQNDQSSEGDKPNWLEMKREKKVLKEKRKAKRLAAIYEPSVKAKSIGEKLRRADCSVEERKKLTKKLYQLLKGSFNRAVFTHDLSRVVQWLLKYCDQEIRELVIKELKPSYVAMFQSKYGKNCLKKALKHGTENIRREIMNSCYSHVVKLLSHSVSSPLVNYVYSNFASDLDKLRFRQEFYGDMYKHAKDDSVKRITDVYATSGDMKSATLSAVKINLLRVLNKKLITSPFVHEILADYLNICTPEDRAEMIVMLRSSIVELAMNESGTRVAIMCIWHGTAKDRKISLKSLKERVKTICKSEQAHVLLMAIFDCIDDTVLVKKLILSEIIQDLVEIASDEYGRRIILYLVARRNSAHFHPTLVESLKQGDENATSKKSADLREKELLEVIVGPLIDSITDNVTAWLANSSIAMVTLSILKRGHGEELRRAYEAIADFIVNDESRIMENGEERVVIEHSGIHMMLKKLVLADKTSADKKSVTFGQVLEERLDKQIIQRWIGFNRGCFLLILLVENGDESVVTSLIKKLKFSSETLKTKKSPGASILLKKIK